MSERSYRDQFPYSCSGNLAVVFQEYRPGKLPIRWAAIKTEDGFEELVVSGVELSSSLLMAAQASRRENGNTIFQPLDQRKDEVEHYRQCSCVFRRNSDPNSNFYTVSRPGDGDILVHNAGTHSIRLQLGGENGTVYRVAAGMTEVLDWFSRGIIVDGPQILLDLGGNPLDLQISAVHVKYGDSPWRRGGLEHYTGAHVDSYFGRVLCGDDCLGVLESHSDYFLETPALELLDIDGYGPSRWYVRNKGTAPLLLIWPDGSTAQVPADGSVYALEILAALNKEA